MKSIQQISQLSDSELKSILRKDQSSYEEIINSSLDLSNIKNDVHNLVNDIYTKVQKGFQIMVEKVIGLEFMNFLNQIAEEGGNTSKNGYYSRKIRTHLGDFDIQIPRACYELFETKLLKKYGHDLGDIQSKVIDLYLGGMTQSEVVEAISSISNIGISREKVGEIVRSTIGESLKFNESALEDCPIVFLDATYVPIKRAYNDVKTVEKEGVLVALGVTKDGQKKVLGFNYGETESLERWKELLRSLKKRGLNKVNLFVTDGLSGMPTAIQEIYPGSHHQRCTVHYKRNLMSYVKEKDRAQISADFNEVMNKSTKDEAISAFEEFRKLWSAKYRGMTRMLNETTDNIFTYLDYPKELKTAICTSNAIESFNAKLKREVRKRILANSEDNATIVIVNICNSYNKSSGRRLLTGLSELTTDKLEFLGFNPIKK